MADDDKRSPKDKVEFADVIVIGAGVAGLNAARCLNQEGNLKVVVLEGRERIGGRILTWETEGVSVDMGASFIHGKMILTDTKKIVNPVYRYCEDESLPFTYGTRRNGYNFYGRDAPVLGKSPYEPGKSLSSWPKSNMLDAGEIQKNVKRYYQKVMSGLRKFQAAKKQDPTFDDISVWDALHQVIQEVGWPFPDSPCLERDFFDYLVWIREEFEGIPYSEMSLLDMDEEDDYLGGNTCLRGGYKCLISSLAKGLDIRLNCCVSDIVQADSNTSSGLMVGVHQGGKGEEEGDVQVLQWYKCKYCICTAPLGVLQHGDLTFKPPLPEETLQGISHLKMGLMDKVALFYHNRFWPDDIYRFVFVSEERRGLWPWLTPCDSLDPTANCGALLAWMACDYAEDAEKKFLSDEEMVDEVMKVVRRIFPGAPKPDSFCVTRWKSEPFSRGSWTSSPVRPVGGKSAAYWSKKMGLPMWGNRLFLAGEHVVDETMNCIGTVTSAFHIGEVQARRILEDSKKGKEEGEE